MITMDEVDRLAMALPEVTVGARWNNRTWFVRDKGFAWERPLSKADIKRWGGAPLPAGPILAVRVADLNEKEAVLAANPASFFTIQHFDNYAAVLIMTDKATKKAVREALTDAWLCCAPKALVTEFLDGKRR